MVGTAIATLRDSPTHTTVSATPVASPVVPSVLDDDRIQERAQRSRQRIAAAPESTPSVAPSSAAPRSTAPSPKPSKPATQAPKPPADAGKVVSGGTCQASFYTDEGGRTASGEIFHVNDFTAAHKTLPFNTRVRVTNTQNGKSTIVRINDRGPFVAGRCLDLSTAAFTAIASQSAGVATVKYEVLG